MSQTEQITSHLIESHDEPSSEAIQAILSECKAPTTLIEQDDQSFVALPPGWGLSRIDHSKHKPNPARKAGVVQLNDVQSFIDFVNREKQTESAIWCDADFMSGKVKFEALINENGKKAGWRDYLATFEPKKSKPWTTWTNNNGKPMGQVEFAHFIEANLEDIASADGLPTGTAMLQMALDFEMKGDMRFKSATRLQSGATNFQFIENEDNGTLTKMEAFERFAIGIPVIWNGDAYKMQARLRYRQRDGNLTFYYELIRHEQVLQDAIEGVVKHIREKVDLPFFYGNPFK